MIVAELMVQHPVTVGRDTGVKDALRLAHEHVVTTLPVLDDGVLVGVVSDIDLVRRLVAPDPRVHALRADGPAVGALHVGDVMTSPAVTVPASADVAAAVEMMAEARLRSLPVLDRHGDLVGIVTRRDVVRLLARPDAEIAEEVRGLVHALALGAESEGGRDVATLVVVDGIVHLTWVGEPRDGVRRAVRTVARSAPGVVGVQDDPADPADPA